MADNSINTGQKYLLNGVEINAAEEWLDVTIKADFESTDNPYLSIDNFTFNLQARELILQWISDGNIFEGMPLKLTLFNNKSTQENFNSILDFSKGYEDFIQDGKLEVGITQKDNIDSFFNKIDTVTFGYLESIGVIQDSDYITVDYVVEKKIDVIEIMITSIMIYLMIKEIHESVMRLADNIAKISSYLSAGLTGTVAAALYAVASAIINVIYTAALVIAVVNLTNDLLNSFLPPKRENKLFNIYKMLSKVCQYYGYGFTTSVAEFSNVAYLPSNQNFDEVNKLGFIKTPKGTDKGIPNSGDLGYICSEAFDFAKKCCNGRFALIDNVVHLHPKDSGFWIKTSTYTKPSVQVEKKKYNLEDLKSTILISFEIDQSDSYTIDNYKGNAIEIKTSIKNPINNNNNLLKGLNEINIGAALGSRKTELNALENILKKTAQIVDSTTKVLGSSTGFANRIKSRVGLLKVSNNNWSIPKLVYLNGNSIPNNHRDLWSAELIWNKFYGDISFVRNNFKGQKVIYEGVSVPFGFEDYKKIMNNPYFTEDGVEAKIINFEWLINSDKAIIDYWKREVYSTNLKETTIIPE